MGLARVILHIDAGKVQVLIMALLEVQNGAERQAALGKRGNAENIGAQRCQLEQLAVLNTRGDSIPDGRTEFVYPFQRIRIDHALRFWNGKFGRDFGASG